MLVSHECPVVMLEESKTFNDYDYALVHLFDQIPEYKEYFYNSLREGRVVYLDNSLFELGTSFDPVKFADICKEMYNINKDNFYYIIPDVWEDRIKTIQSFNRFGFKKGNKIGVVQGKDYIDALCCVMELRDKCDILAFSFGARWYEDITNEGNMFERRMRGRQYFVRELSNKGLLKNKKIHLLGCYLPQEFIFYKENNIDVFSIDTSNPIVHGLKNIEYKDCGLDEKVEIKMADLMGVKEIPQAVYYNIKRFREFIS